MWTVDMPQGKVMVERGGHEKKKKNLIYLCKNFVIYNDMHDDVSFVFSFIDLWT